MFRMSRVAINVMGQHVIMDVNIIMDNQPSEIFSFNEAGALGKETLSWLLTVSDISSYSIFGAYKPLIFVYKDGYVFWPGPGSQRMLKAEDIHDVKRLQTAIAGSEKCTLKNFFIHKVQVECNFNTAYMFITVDSTPICSDKSTQTVS